MTVLVDSNVLLDLIVNDDQWCDWSRAMVSRWADLETLVINPIIYAEISIGYPRITDLDTAMPETFLARESLPYEAGFVAGKCFQRYRKLGGAKTSPLPDFYIGAHAATRGYRLLTRDVRRYRTYFPTVELIGP